MKKLVSAALIMASFGASADCWIVDNLHGQSQFSPSYVVQKDKVVGAYYVKIDGGTASLSSVDGEYKSELTYTPISPTSTLGSSANSALTETWTITPGGKVLYTKVRNNSSGISQLSSFIGDVKGKC